MGHYRGKEGTRTETRVVCANENHRYHAFTVPNHSAGQVLIETEEILNLYDHGMAHDESCRPFSIEQRTVTMWETVDG